MNLFRFLSRRRQAATPTPLVSPTEQRRLRFLQARALDSVFRNPWACAARLESLARLARPARPQDVVPFGRFSQLRGVTSAHANWCSMLEAHASSTQELRYLVADPDTPETLARYCDRQLRQRAQIAERARAPDANASQTTRNPQ